MTLDEAFQANYLDGLTGYYRNAWSPVYYILVNSNPKMTINHRYLVSRPIAGQWKHYYLDPSEAAQADWNTLPSDQMNNYWLAQGLVHETPNVAYVE